MSRKAKKGKSVVPGFGLTMGVTIAMLSLDRKSVV